MPSDLLHGFRVGLWTVEPLKGTISSPENEARHLQPKVMDVLVCLATHAPDPVTRDDLLKEVWGKNAVSDEPLTHAIGELRRVLDDDRGHPQYIKTIPKRGYRLFREVHPPEGVGLEKDVSPGRSIRQRAGRWLASVVTLLVCGAVILFAYDEWWTEPPPEKSIAVLPFVNLSGDPEQEYFSDGISEDILNLLSRITDLTVRPRQTSFSLKGKNVDAPTIAAQLNVAYVLQGSVRKVGNRVRVTAQLIEASTDSHIWSQSYDRELNDIFAVQDDIAGAISNALKLKLVLIPGGIEQPTAIKAANADAYDAYLRGRELLRLRGPENIQSAIRNFERSLLLDDNFAPAHAQLAIAISLSGYPLGTPEWEEATQRAIRHLDRAQELEPELAEGHGGRALLGRLRRDPEATIEHARRAMVSNPSYADAMNWIWLAQIYLGRYLESDVTIQQMLVIDPLNDVGRHNNAARLGRRGQVEQAHQIADQLIVQNPRMGYLSHGRTSFYFEGKIADSLFWNLKAMAAGGGAGSPDLALGFAWVAEYDEARRIPGYPDYLIDLFEGHFGEASAMAQEAIDLKPNGQEAIELGAVVYYAARRFEKARPLYERLLDFVPEGRPFLPSSRFGNSGLERTMQLALLRRYTGDENAAQAAARIVRKEHAARHTAGRKHQYQHRAEAMLAAFDTDPAAAIAALRSAIQLGLREPRFLDDPIFEILRNKPRFVALREELDTLLAAEHEKVLQLICFNNPTPDNWQPLPETCEGVVRQIEH